MAIATLPYTATSISVVSRGVFMVMLYNNKSTKTLSLVMCVLSITSSCMWIYYSIHNDDTPMVIRSSIEITLNTISAIYIIHNKIKAIDNRDIKPVS